MPPVLHKEKKDYVSLGNYRRLEELNTPRFLKNRVRPIEKNYSKAEIEEFAKDWCPWDYIGDEGRGANIFNMYGLIGGLIVRAYVNIRRRLKKFNLRETDISMSLTEYLTNKKNRNNIESFILTLLQIKFNIYSRLFLQKV